MFLFSRRCQLLQLFQQSHPPRKRKSTDRCESRQQQQQQLRNDITVLENAYEVRLDPIKGRYLVAAMDLEPGVTIMRDQPAVHATWHTHRCFECSGVHLPTECPVARKLYPQLLLESISDAQEEMADMEGIMEIDRARSVIKALWAMQHDDDLKRAIMVEATAHKVEILRETVEEMLQSPNICNCLPPNSDIDTIARVLAVLNTNCHDLPDMGGSGLFLNALLMEHGCTANCNFNTHFPELWLTVIEPVKKGQALSIDYGNAPYLPISMRKQFMMDSYGFTCTCQACTSLPDKTRRFSCERCRGVMCPVPPYDDGTIEHWKCLGCKQELQDARAIKKIRMAEKNVEKNPPETIEEIDLMLKKHKGLLESHYLIYHCLVEIGKGHASNTLDCKSGLAENVWKRVLHCAEQVIPKYHHEWPVLYDILAQIRVRAGDIQGAKDAYKKAYDVSVVCSGRNTLPTLDLLLLLRDTPTNEEALLSRYNNIKEHRQALAFEENQRQKSRRRIN